MTGRVFGSGTVKAFLILGDGARTGVVVAEVLWLLWVLVTGPELFVLE
jgi:hypothetical protein